MTVKKAVKFSSQKMKFGGFPDYGEDVVAERKTCGSCPCSHVSPIQGKMGTIYSCLCDKWCRKFVNASEIGDYSITALHTVDAIVSNVTCEGQQTNKGVHGLFGISGQLENLKSWIEYPCNPTKKNHFIFDVPHIF